MQRIFSTLKQAFGQKILILGMLSLSMLSGLFIFVQQPSLAAPISTEGQKLIQQEKLDRQSQEADKRSDAYEEQVKAAKDPDKVYEENVKAYKGTLPGENLVDKTVQGAEKLVDKVKGKD
jgi:hypothetical protein